MTLWFGIQGQVTSAKNISPLCRHPQRTLIQNEKKFFNLNYVQDFLNLLRI